MKQTANACTSPFGLEAANYSINVSIAYMANSIFDMQLKKEPWLHVREVRLTKTDNGKFVQMGIYYVVYVWDTREVVQWVEDKRSYKERPHLAEQSKRYVKAVDNAQPLKDTSHLVPDWAMQKLSKREHLYSMTNEPKEVQDAYYAKRHYDD